MQLTEKKLQLSEDITLQNVDETGKILEKKIQNVQKNFEELNQYYKMAGLENINGKLLMEIIDQIQEMIQQLKKMEEEVEKFKKNSVIKVDELMKEEFMVNQTEQEMYFEITEESIELANQARLEQYAYGKVSVICPKCQEHPEIYTTPGGERTTITCKCGYIRNGEINF